MAELKPLLLPRVRLERGTAVRAGTTLSIEDPGQWDRFTDLLKGCDGSRTISELATAAREPLHSVQETLESLRTNGFLWLQSDYKTIPTEVFREEFKRWVPIWVDFMYSQPWWSRLYDGTAPASVLVGLSIEQMHYTRSVSAHMPVAVSYAGGVADELTQFKHLSEEWDHYYLFVDACVAAGIPAEFLENSRPLASTKVVTAFMRRVARQGTLVYNACEAILEATTQNDPPVTEFYRVATERLGLPEEFSRQHISHVSADADFEHIDIFDQLLEGRATLPSATVATIFSYCRQLAETFALWHVDIYEFYSGLTRYGPIRIVDVPLASPRTELPLESTTC